MALRLTRYAATVIFSSVMRAADALILIAVLGCAPSRPLLSDLAQIADTAGIAIVESDRAVFVFPTETRNVFLWPTNSRDPEADKYAWGITIISGDTSFLPGVQVYRGVHPAPFSSLVDVVAAGPSQLLYNPGGHVQMLDQATRVSTRVSNGRVIVTLNGAAQIQRIFRDSPVTVRFGVVAPLEPLWRQDVVDVQYHRSARSRSP